MLRGGVTFRRGVRCPQSGVCSSSSSVCHSEEQDSVSNQRLHPDAEDGPDVALQEEAQTAVGSFPFPALLLTPPFTPFPSPRLTLPVFLHPFDSIDLLLPSLSSGPPVCFMLLLPLPFPLCSHPLCSHLYLTPFTPSLSPLPPSSLCIISPFGSSPASLCSVSLITCDVLMINPLRLLAALLAVGCGGVCDCRGRVGAVTGGGVWAQIEIE